MSPSTNLDCRIASESINVVSDCLNSVNRQCGVNLINRVNIVNHVTQVNIVIIIIIVNFVNVFNIVKMS